MTDHWDGYRLGKAAVTAEQFPRWGKTMDDYSAKLNRHLIRLGLQLLNEHKRIEKVARDEQTLRVQFVGTWTTLSAEDLADLLWQCIPDNAVNWEGEHEGPRSFRLSIQRMDRLVTLAAAYARQEWRGDWEAENRRRAAVGGRRSRRGATYSLEAFLALPEGLTKQQQAEALGCSLGTVDNLRRTAKEQQAQKAEAPAPVDVERVMTTELMWHGPSTQSDTRFFEKYEERMEQARLEFADDTAGLLDDLLAP